MGKTIDYRAIMAKQRERDKKKKACREYLKALDLPAIFAGEPGSHCPSCGSDDVDISGCGWKCENCEAEGEIKVEAVASVAAGVEPCDTDRMAEEEKPEPITCETLEELLGYFRKYEHLSVLAADDPATLRLGWVFYDPENDDGEAPYITMRLRTAKKVLPPGLLDSDTVTPLRELASGIPSPYPMAVEATRHPGAGQIAMES